MQKTEMYLSYTMDITAISSVDDNILGKNTPHKT
jgi:hypothetical protein